MHWCIGQRERGRKAQKEREAGTAVLRDPRDGDGGGSEGRRKCSVREQQKEGVKDKENSDGKLICTGPSLAWLAWLCYICRWKNQLQHILDNSTRPPLLLLHHRHHHHQHHQHPPRSLITHSHSIPLHSPVHKNNKTLIAHICMLVAPPPDMIRIMNAVTKGDCQLSASLILIGWRSLSLSNLMHNAHNSNEILYSPSLVLKLCDNQAYPAFMYGR